MNLRLLQKGDTEFLANLHRKRHFKDVMELSADYLIPFSDYQNLSGPPSQTLVLEDLGSNPPQIQGSVSFIIREVLLSGKRERVAFAKDLALTPTRQALLGWMKYYQSTLHHIKREFQCKYIFSYILDGDVSARSALLRPKGRRAQEPRYHFFRKVSLVSLHGKYPWAKNPLPNLRVIPLEPRDEDAFFYYFAQASVPRELSTIWGPETFLKALKRKPGMEMSQIWIALDSQDRIVGATSHWSPKNLFLLHPKTSNHVGSNFQQFTQFGHWLRWTRRLTDPLQFSLIPFFAANNEDIFESLLWHLWQEIPKENFLVYAYARSEFRYRRPFNWITARLPYSLYLILDPEEEPPDFLHPSHDSPTECDPLLIW